MKQTLLLLGCLAIVSFLQAQTLKVEGELFSLDGKPFDMWGVRVASASQTEKYTQSLIANLDDYKASGINCISVFLQGSSGGYSDPFEKGGLSIDIAHFNRISRIIEACAKRDMVVIAGIFYQRTIRNPKVCNLKTETDIRNAVVTATKLLKPYKNVILNIANEQNSTNYNAFKGFDFNNPENIVMLCKLAKNIDPERIVGGGGYHDSSNVLIGKSEHVDVLLFDTFDDDVAKGHSSGWHFNYFKNEGVPFKPIVNVEIFGGWTQKFIPQGVYTDDGKDQHFIEIEDAKTIPGLYVHFHSNPWFQGVAQKFENHFDLGGDGSSENPGVRWFFENLTR